MVRGWHSYNLRSRWCASSSSSLTLFHCLWWKSGRRKLMNGLSCSRRVAIRFSVLGRPAALDIQFRFPFTFSHVSEVDAADGEKLAWLVGPSCFGLMDQVENRPCQLALGMEGVKTLVMKRVLHLADHHLDAPRSLSSRWRSIIHRARREICTSDRASLPPD